MTEQTLDPPSGRTRRRGLDVKSIAWQQNWLRWRLADDLCGGTRAMRFAATLWLPKEDKERQDCYNIRLQNSFLFPAFQKTVERASGKPFVEPVKLVTSQGKTKGSKSINVELPGDLAEISENIDRAGKTLTDWCREEFRDRVKYSAAIFLVLYPNVERTLALDRAGRDNAPPPGSPPNDEEKARLAFQPYFARVLPENLLGAEFADRGDGVRRLSRVRIRETFHETDEDGYTQKVIEEVRVLTPGRFERWRRIEVTAGGTQAALQETSRTWGMSPSSAGSGLEFELLEEGPLLDIAGRPFPEIPLVCDPPDYLQRQFGMDELPLEQLAWLNVAHWQSMSDQRNCLRIARVPFLVSTGVTEEDKESVLAIGPTTHWKMTSKDARTEYIEPKGTALAAGQTDLDKLEDMMTVLGMQPFVKKQVRQTATERQIDEDASISEAQGWVRSFAGAVLRGVKLAALWVGETLPDGLQVEIFDDFGVSSDIPAKLDFLLKARVAREIPQRQFLLEVQLLGGLQEGADIEEMISELQSEAPPLPSLLPRAPLPGQPGKPNGQLRPDMPPAPPRPSGNTSAMPVA